MIRWDLGGGLFDTLWGNSGASFCAFSLMEQRFFLILVTWAPTPPTPEKYRKLIKFLTSYHFNSCQEERTSKILALPPPCGFPICSAQRRAAKPNTTCRNVFLGREFSSWRHRQLVRRSWVRHASVIAAKWGRSARVEIVASTLQLKICFCVFSGGKLCSSVPYCVTEVCMVTAAVFGIFHPRVCTSAEKTKHCKNMCQGVQIRIFLSYDVGKQVV